MRQRIVAANWKMNLDFSSAKFLANDIDNQLDSVNVKGVTLILCVPYPYLDFVSSLFVNSVQVFAGAQNCYWEREGAYTGEVSARMVRSVGGKYVIVGHSERRSLFHETDEIIAKKTNSLLENNLKPIICCGEKLEERENDDHFNIVKHQLEAALGSVDVYAMENVTIAYEPVWAIGTGKSASSKQAQEMHLFIREFLSDKYDAEVANNTSIIYGGSCKSTNSEELFSQPDIDGGLIGGASLNAESFLKIASSFPNI